MRNKRQYQIETAFSINGWTFMDVSTPKFPNHIMICDTEDFEKWADDKKCGSMLAFQTVTSTYPYSYMTHGDGPCKFFHRYVMPHLDYKGAQVDHINHNGLDNRKSNLRDGANGVNAWNQRLASINKSGYRGVSWKKENKKWCAQITMDYHVKHLGLFDDPEAASERYENAYSRRERGLSFEEL